MSQVDQERQDLWSRGLRTLKQTNVCSTHFDDDAIKNFINTNSKPGYCSYCNRSKKIVPFGELMFFIMKGIMNFYEDAAEFMSYDSREGGYLGTTYTQWELINDVIGLEIDNQKLNEDIVDCIDDRAWSEPNSYYDSYRDILVYHWDFFKDVTKHKARYLFGHTDKFKTYSYNQRAYDILNEIGKKVNEFNLISEIAQGTKIYRCRQHDATKMIKSAPQLAAPPVEYAVYPNRMSPAGISMFYCAFDPDTAIAETIDTTKAGSDHFTIAAFEPNKTLHVIDLTNLPTPPSMFDVENFKNFYSTRFLRDFVDDISKSITRDGKEHIDYVPTQIVTEYFRYIFTNKSKIDGLIYPSAKKRSSKCCVLFFDNEECSEELNFIHSSVETRKITI